jgi:hypothetical protein
MGISKELDKKDGEVLNKKYGKKWKKTKKERKFQNNEKQ